jgi:hypothetical protein
MGVPEHQAAGTPDRAGADLADQTGALIERLDRHRRRILEFG